MEAVFPFISGLSLEDGEIQLRQTATLPAPPELGGVPTYRFAIVRQADGRAVGGCELRVGFSEVLYYAGNIGYHVDEPYRGHHYALKACRLLLDLARLHRMPQVVITCRPDNLPSRRVCEELGAKLRTTGLLPPNQPLYRQGDRRECRYILPFDEFR